MYSYKKFENKVSEIVIVESKNISSNLLHWRLPSSILISNINHLTAILEITIEDWLKKIKPYQRHLNRLEPPVINKLHYITKTNKKLRPFFLKSLFSYVLFFKSINNAYKKLNKEIKELKSEIYRKTGKRIKTSKNTLPEIYTFDYLKKVKIIRDISISHIESENKGRKMTALLASEWDFTTYQFPENYNFEKAVFASGKWISRNKNDNKVIEESSDLEIKGILELHSNCVRFIDECDKVCSNQYKEIVNYLPLSNIDIKIDFFK